MVVGKRAAQKNSSAVAEDGGNHLGLRGRLPSSGVSDKGSPKHTHEGEGHASRRVSAQPASGAGAPSSSRIGVAPIGGGSSGSRAAPKATHSTHSGGGQSSFAKTMAATAQKITGAVGSLYKHKEVNNDAPTK